MVTKTYQPSNQCDSSDGSDSSNSWDSSDNSDSSDSSESSDKKKFIKKKIITKKNHKETFLPITFFLHKKKVSPKNSTQIVIKCKN